MRFPLRSKIKESNGEIAVFEDLNGSAIAGFADDFEVCCADHEIDVGIAFGVDAGRFEFILAEGFAALYAGGIRLAEGEVAGGILVKECIEEEYTAVGYGRIVRDEGDLTEVMGAFVEVYLGAEGFLVGIRVDIDNAAVLECEA